MSQMTPYLVCPEFLPALTRLLARSGLPLSALAKKTVAAEEDSSSTVPKLALEECLRSAGQSDDEAERYAAEVLLAHETTAGWSGRAGEPPVAAELRAVRHDALSRLVIPGAVILGVNAHLLRRGPKGIAVLAAADLLGENQDGGHREQQELVDIVICEVAYSEQLEPSTSVPSAQHGAEVLCASEVVPKTSATKVVRALRVEVIQTPRASLGRVSEATVNAESAWAEALCRRCASPVFVAPAFHTQLAQLLVDVGASPASLSARSASARGQLAAKLVALARRLRASSQEAKQEATTGAAGERAAELDAKANVCLAAASASSAVTTGAILGTSLDKEDAGGAPLLLLKGRDAVPEGALVAGATVERELGHGVSVSFGACGVSPLLLTKRRMPRSRISVALPVRGTPLACLLLRPEAQESGLADSAVPALAGSSCATLEDVLARQVGLRVLSVPVPDGRPSRATACRHLAEAFGASLRVEIAPDGLSAHITGAPSEVEAAARVVASLAGLSLPVPERLAWRIVGRRGTGVRQLEQDSGGTWIRVESDQKSHTVDIFGERSAVNRAKALIEERHAYDSLEIPSDTVSRIIGRGGSGIREIEASSGGASISVDAEKCLVEVMGEAPVVQRAMAELRERSAPSRRMEVPRRVVPYVIGRNGSNKREMETASGAFLRVETEAENCFVEISGHRSSIDKAVLLMERLLQQHAYASFEAPRDLAQHLSGHGGVWLREVQASAGASVQIGCFRDHCLVEAFGEQAAVDAALEVLKRRTVVSRRQISIPRPSLSYVVGRAGAGVQDIEVATGSSLQVDLGCGHSSGMCTIEARGDDKQIDDAEAMLRARSESSKVKVPSNRVSWIIGRGGATIRELQASTSASIYVPQDHDATCEVQVYGSPDARSMACEKIAALLSDAGAEPGSTSNSTCNSVRQRSRSPRLARSAAGTAAETGGSTCTSRPHLPAAVSERSIFAPKAKMLVPAKESLLQGKKFPEAFKLSKNAAAAGLPWHWQLPVDLNSPPPKSAAQVQEREKDQASDAAQSGTLSGAELADSSAGAAADGCFAVREQNSVSAAESSAESPPAIRKGAGESLLLGKDLPEQLLMDTNREVPWVWKWPLRVDSPPKKDQQAVGDEQSAQIHDGARLTTEGPTVQRPPNPPSSWENSKSNPHPAANASSDAGEVVPSGVEATPRMAAAAETPSSPLPNLQWVRNAPAPRTDLSGGRLDSPSLCARQNLEGADTARPTHDWMPHKAVQPFPWSWSLPVQLDDSTSVARGASAQMPEMKSVVALADAAAHDTSQVAHGASAQMSETKSVVAPADAAAQKQLLSRGRSRSPRRGAGPQNSASEAASGEATRKPPAAPRRSGKGVPPGPPPPPRWSLPASRAKAAACAVAQEAKAEPPANHQAAKVTVPCIVPPLAQCPAAKVKGPQAAAPALPEIPLFPAASLDSASWAALPTPVRASAPLSPAQPPAKRQRRGPSPEVGPLATTSSPKLFVLDGMNILKSSNSISWGADDKEQSLEWAQLERACRYYTSRGHHVSVYLPPLRAGHEEQLERCCREFGNIFVSCRSASDDQFMINTVKLYEDEHGRGDLEGPSHDQREAEPCCCIVTNDRFEDWKQRGDVNSAWVERHCVRFAFGPGGFVPSKLI